MKGDFIIRKKYVDVVKNFFLGETTTPNFWILFMFFWVAIIVIQIALVAMFAYIDNDLHGAISGMQVTWTFYGWFVIYQGNVCLDGLKLLGDFDLIFAMYILVVACCDTYCCVSTWFEGEL